jgi:hypothetical protein
VIAGGGAAWMGAAGVGELLRMGPAAPAAPAAPQPAAGCGLGWLAGAAVAAAAAAVAAADTVGRRYIRSFPSPTRLHPFEEALLDLTVGG